MSSELEIRKEQKKDLAILMELKKDPSKIDGYIKAQKIEMEQEDVALVEKMVNEG